MVTANGGDETTTRVVDAAVEFIVAHEAVERGRHFSEQEVKAIRTVAAGTLAWVMTGARRLGPEFEVAVGATLVALTTERDL